MHACKIVFLLAISGSLLIAAQTPNAEIHDIKTKQVTPPRPLKTPAPIYPLFAPNDGICVVSILVDVKGTPQEPRIIRCTDNVFGPNSLTAVMQWVFAPATSEGQPIPFRANVEVRFLRQGGQPSAQIAYPLPQLIHVDFLTPPNITTTTADENGIYQLTKIFLAPNTVPSVSAYHGNDFMKLASKLPGKSGCDVLVTIDAKGKASDAQVSRCLNTELEKSALDAILMSHYKPATLNNNPVPVRTLVRIVFTNPGNDKH